jgi:hypothetical protein
LFSFFLFSSSFLLISSSLLLPYLLRLFKVFAPESGCQIQFFLLGLVFRYSPRLQGARLAFDFVLRRRLCCSNRSPSRPLTSPEIKDTGDDD